MMSSARGSVLGFVSTLCMVVGALLLTSAPALAGEGCSNEERRVEQRSTFLPDCRAYELVEQGGTEPITFHNRPQNNQYQGTGGSAGTGSFSAVASVTGNRFSFYSRYGAPPGSYGPGPEYLSTRGQYGWSTQEVIPPQSVDAGLTCLGFILGYSPDLSKLVIADGNFQQQERYLDEHQSEYCGHDEPLLVPGEPELVQNIFLDDSETGSYQLLDLNQPKVPRNAWFQAGSADFSHIVFTDAAKLTPEAPTPPEYAAQGYSVGEDLYENSGGVVRLVTILPDGTPVWGLLANGGEGYNESNSVWTHAVSADGERVFFYAEGELEPRNAYRGGNLYLRENAAQSPSALEGEKCTEPAKACTVQVDAKQGGAGPSGGGHFQWASTDGSKVFFTDESKLTADSTADAGKPDLYEYDVERPLAERLADLTANAPEPASVQGLSGISEDGSYVYFVAEGVLTGTEQNSQGAKAEAGQPNLYLRHVGATTYIATLLPSPREGDGCDWYSAPPQGAVGEDHCFTARVSPNGQFLGFDSLKSVTGYDNTPVDQTVSKGCTKGVGFGSEPAPCQEVFLYETAQNKLSCASCDPGGTRPIFAASIQNPTRTDAMWGDGPTTLQRQVSDNGQVFFDTQNRLLTSDVNNAINVYEYQGGHLHLISSGASNDDSYFYGASASGNDVFFITEQALVSSDTDETNSLYDARVGGGFLAGPAVGPGGVVEAPPCESVEACKPPPGESPAEPFPASSAFSGAGNLVSPPPPGLPAPKKVVKKAIKCPKGKKLNHGKCVKKKPNKSKTKKSIKRRGSK